MGAMTKEELWYYLKDPHTTKKEAFRLLDDFADFWFEKGWSRHKRLKRVTQSLKAMRMKEDFDEWYDSVINKYALKDLEKIQDIYYDHIPQTHSSK